MTHPAYFLCDIKALIQICIYLFLIHNDLIEEIPRNALLILIVLINLLHCEKNATKTPF